MERSAFESNKFRIGYPLDRLQLIQYSKYNAGGTIILHNLKVDFGGLSSIYI